MAGSRKLGRSSDHRKAMLRAMVTYLFIIVSYLSNTCIFNRKVHTLYRGIDRIDRNHLNKPNIEITEISEDKKYGRFVVEPLERGYGTTLGNSLRRIMVFL